MKVTLRELTNANAALQGSQQLGIQGIMALSMQPDLAFKLALAQKQMAKHLEAMDTARQKLIEEYQVDVDIDWPEDYTPKKGEKKKTRKEIPEDKVDEVNEKFGKLLDKKVDVDIQKIPQVDFQKYGLKSIAPDQLMALEFMINLKK